MYKTYNFEPKSLSPRRNVRNGFKPFPAFQSIAEKLMPFLIIAATFVWLWK